jgi:7-cyano-7-deazaguanine synthase
MQNIWFCHTPIKGKPCGLCHPCDVKMESDMLFLLPEKAQKRYKIHRFCSAKFGRFGERVSAKILRRI